VSRGSSRSGLFRAVFTTLVFAALVAGAAVLVLRPAWLNPRSEQEEEKEVEAEVPVKVGPATRMTLSRWVEAYGTVDAAPVSEGHPAGGATVSSPVAGVIGEVLCSPGKTVEPGAVLFKLDERLAAAAEEQAAAAVESAKASLQRIRIGPRPEQVQLAQFAVEKATEGVAFAQKTFDRLKLLSGEQIAATKTLEAAAHDLASAQNDLKSAQLQLALLKSTPTPEELAEATAKAAETEKALATARAQRSMLLIRSPLRATVTRVMASAGESADPTKALAQLIALDRLVLNAAVTPDQASLVKPGQTVRIVAEAESSAATTKSAPATAPATRAAATTAPAEATEADAKVSLVGYDVDRKNNTVGVTIDLGPGAGVRPGEFLRARILVDQHRGALAVPWKSVVRGEDQSTSVAVVHDEKAHRVPVRVGLREGEWVEITGQGVTEGDLVVTDGAYGLPDDAKVSVQEK
jgi:membrane fusion protein (multidrug efflux system)